MRKTSTAMVFFHGDSETGEEVLRLDMATGEVTWKEGWAADDAARHFLKALRDMADGFDMPCARCKAMDALLTAAAAHTHGRSRNTSDTWVVLRDAVEAADGFVIPYGRCKDPS